MVAPQESGDGVVGAVERVGPVVEEALTNGREAIGALGPARQVIAPPRGYDAFLLQAPEYSVQVARVHSLLWVEILEHLGQLVAMRLATTQDEEERRFDEPLDAGVNLEAVAVGPLPAAASGRATVMDLVMVAEPPRHAGFVLDSEPVVNSQCVTHC